MKHVKYGIVYALCIAMPYLQASNKNLIDAALDNDLTTFQATLHQGANINEQNKHGDTALMKLMKMKNKEDRTDDQIVQAIKIFLDHHADYEIANKNGDNPLLLISSMNSPRDHKILDMLLYRWAFVFAIKRKINVEVRDKHGNTPLIKAAAHGNNYAVERLLLYGAHIDAANSHEYTALGMAEKEDKTSTIQLLERHGATIKKTKSLPKTQEKPTNQTSQTLQPGPVRVKNKSKKKSKQTKSTSHQQATASQILTALQNKSQAS